jgi:hypothetical protein
MGIFCVVCIMHLMNLVYDIPNEENEILLLDCQVRNTFAVFLRHLFLIDCCWFLSIFTQTPTPIGIYVNGCTTSCLLLLFGVHSGKGLAYHLKNE